MRRWSLLCLPLLASCGGSAVSWDPGAISLAVSEISIVDVEAGRMWAEQTVLIADEVIVAIGPAGEIVVPDAVEVVDGAGLFLIPGLWDSHVHLANRAEAELSPERQLREYLRWGVVGVRDMGGDWAVLSDLRQKIADGRLRGPRIVAAGPFLDGGGEAPVFRAVAGEEDAREAVRELAAAGVDFLKVQARLPELEFRAILDEAVTAGLPVAGHVPDALRVDEVVSAGLRSVEHISPALPSDAGLLFGCSAREGDLRGELAAIQSEAREPGADRRALLKRQIELQEALFESVDEEQLAALAKLMAEREVWATPTLVWSRSFAPVAADDVPADAPVNILPKETAARWREQRSAYADRVGARRLAHNLRMADEAARVVARLHGEGVRILAGTDSFDGFVLPGHSLHRELELLVEGGLEPAAALRSATLEAARFRGEAEREGSVAVGKRADLVLLRSDPLVDIRHTRDIELVLVGGKAVGREGSRAVGE